MEQSLYSKNCKKYVYECIKEYYQENSDSVFKEVNSQFKLFVSELPKEWQADKNFHAKQAGTFDCIMLMAFYKICKDKVSVKRIEKINNDLLLPSYRKLSFVNYNWKFLKPIMHKVFQSAKKRCDTFHDFEMELEDYDKNKPVSYGFTYCPIADFAKHHELEEVMPAMCNGDYYAMELLHARLIRKKNCVTEDYCDYTIVGDKDPCLKDHEEYIDEKGYIRNR